MPDLYLAYMIDIALTTVGSCELLTMIIRNPMRQRIRMSGAAMPAALSDPDPVQVRAEQVLAGDSGVPGSISVRGPRAAPCGPSPYAAGTRAPGHTYQWITRTPGTVISQVTVYRSSANMHREEAQPVLSSTFRLVDPRTPSVSGPCRRRCQKVPCSSVTLAADPTTIMALVLTTWSHVVRLVSRGQG